MSPVEGWLGGLSIEGDYLYWWGDNDGLQRVAKTGGAPQVVMNVEDDALAFDVVGEHVYWTSSDGSLWRSPVIPGTAPNVLLERRGGYDDGDYPPLLAVDDQVIYWHAGPNVGERRSDGEPLGLYYRCRH